MKLVSGGGDLEGAGGFVREHWQNIMDIDPSQIESLLTASSPEEQSLVWMATLYIMLLWIYKLFHSFLGQ